MERLYTCEEVAERYHVKPLTVWDWIRKKRLKAIKTGKSYLVGESDMEQFDQACREKAAGK